MKEASSKWLALTRDQQVRSRLGPDFDFQKLVESVGLATSGPLFEAWQHVKEIKPGIFLAVGFDETGAAIYEISADYLPARLIHAHAAIGSGATYARTIFDVREYSESTCLADALYLVFSAKKAA